MMAGEVAQAAVETLNEIHANPPEYQEATSSQDGPSRTEQYQKRSVVTSTTTFSEKETNTMFQ